VSDALLVRDVGHQIAGRWVLDGVSFSVEPGHLLAVVGPAGAGKTTLLHILAGLLPAHRGQVSFAGRAPQIGAGCALVPQVYGLSPSLTAAENVALLLQDRGVPRDEAARRAQHALRRLGVEAASHHLAGELSGGQQQRVAVARAIVTDPALLLADEPTSELDSANRALVLELLTERADAGAVVLVASHDPEVAAIADRQLTLAGGHGTLQEGASLPGGGTAGPP
jgi:putative ABC transport system ATP-binding protein